MPNSAARIPPLLHLSRTTAPKYTHSRETPMRSIMSLATILAVFLGASCSGADAVLVTNSLLATNAAVHPAVMRAVDGIPGWTREGDAETYTKDGLYGYIDGGAEIVLQYGFRELAVFKFKPAAGAAAAAKELVLEVYRMESAEAAFGIYSTKLEGDEERWPGVKADHWISPGQGGLVKGEYMVNILAPECTGREIGEFAAALEPKIPGRGTARPKGMDWLPRAGLVLGSWRYIRGPLAAQGESPFLEAAFWGFGAAPGTDKGVGSTEAYSAKYGVAPAVSKLVIVKFGKAPEASALGKNVLAVFNEYLKDARSDGGVIEGRNAADRWFLFGAKGAAAALVLGDPDRRSALTRLELALSRVPR
jgi:hypothetical protein